jgi:hypothetical protein
MENICEKCHQELPQEIKKGDKFLVGQDIEGKDIIKEVFDVYNDVVFIDYCGISITTKYNILKNWKRLN